MEESTPDLAPGHSLPFRGNRPRPASRLPARMWPSMPYRRASHAGSRSFGDHRSCAPREFGCPCRYCDGGREIGSASRGDEISRSALFVRRAFGDQVGEAQGGPENESATKKAKRSSRGAVGVPHRPGFETAIVALRRTLQRAAFRRKQCFDKSSVSTRAVPPSARRRDSCELSNFVDRSAPLYWFLVLPS